MLVALHAEPSNPTQLFPACGMSLRARIYLKTDLVGAHLVVAGNSSLREEEENDGKPERIASENKIYAWPDDPPPRG